jgi:hypothetical protein
MPGQRTASGLVTIFRNLMKETGPYRIRNGFSTDADTSPTLLSALTYINLAYGIVARHMGYGRHTFSQSASAGQDEFTISAAAGEGSDWCWYQGGAEYDLRDVTLAELKRRRRTWRNVTASGAVPRVVAIDANRYFLYPAPLAAGEVRYRAFAPPGDLTAATSIPSGVPDVYHDAIGILAVAVAAGANADDPVMAARRDNAMDVLARTYPEMRALVDARAINTAISTHGTPPVEPRERL